MAKRVVGPVSWFGGPNDGMDSGKTAGGQTTATPGVAIRPGAHYESGRATLGGYWRITDPKTGKSVVLKQTDIGPNQSTGRRIDVTYSALRKFGYSERNFPTDANWQAEYLGKNPGTSSPGARTPTRSQNAPAGGSDLQAQARRQAAAQWLLSSSKSTADLENRVAQAEATVPAQTVTPKGPTRVRQQQPAAIQSNALHPGSPVPHQGPRASTHPTAGLPNFPAYDYMAPAGTASVAPVSGTVVKVSGSDPKNGPPNGPHGPFGLSVYIRGNDGRTYYLTHMGSRTVKVGQRVGQGQRIGSVGNYAKWGGADHIHMGVSG